MQRELRRAAICFERECRADLERTNARTSQGLDIAAAAETFAQVAGQRADIRSLAAADFQVKVGICVPDQANGVDLHVPGREIDVRAAPGQNVSATAGNLGGGIHRRRLGNHHARP